MSASHANCSRSKPVNQYDITGKYICKFSSAAEAARAIGAPNRSAVGDVCAGRSRQYKGHLFRWRTDEKNEDLKNDSSMHQMS
jgi:hypothetical protein